MKELDLHGYLHSEVEAEVENFLVLNSRHLPLRIITGYSGKMKSIVTTLLERYNFEYYIPDHNAGEIIVIHDSEGMLI
jgi:DNA-nicking Smr family endonuclease